MEPFTVGVIGSVVLLVLLILGVHVGIALGTVGFVGLSILMGPGSAIAYTASAIFYVITNYMFIVLPLFIIMGFLASQGGVARETYDSLEKWIGNVRGGSGIATVWACAVFGLFTGSAMVAAATFTRVSAPELRRMGYEKSFTYGLIASSSTIAMLIPPSALAVIYGLISGDSISKLLLGGIGPGLTITVIYTMGIFLLLKINPSLAGTPKATVATLKEKFLALPYMWPVAVIAAILIGGIYGGVFTTIEAGAAGAAAILLIGVILRRIRWSDVKRSAVDTVEVCAMVFLIFACARVFSRFLTIAGISSWILNFTFDLNLSPLAFTIAVTVVFIILGFFLDSVSMLTLVLPLVIPVVKALGIDPIWFAMVQLVAIHVGMITPPFGICVYVTLGAAEKDVSLEDIFRGVLPFVLFMAISLVLIIIFPQLCTWAY
jgi:C4-dicarboxylate transporter DctM subunit